MNDMATIVSVVTIAACLVLALRNFRSRRPKSNQMLLMGVIWAVIIAGLAYALQGAGP